MLHTMGSEKSIIDQYGTSKDEKSDPMEEWRPRRPRCGSYVSNPFGNHGDIGDRRMRKLLSVQEVPLHPTSVRGSTISVES